LPHSTHRQRQTITALGPGFIALQVLEPEASAAFYIEHLGLVRAPVSPEHAVLFATEPIAFAVREPFVASGPESRGRSCARSALAPRDGSGCRERPKSGYGRSGYSGAKGVCGGIRPVFQGMGVASGPLTFYSEGSVRMASAARCIRRDLSSLVSRFFEGVTFILDHRPGSSASFSRINHRS
jgi:hypothetical protein